MAGTITLPANDSRPLAIALRASAKTLPQQGAIAVELTRVLDAWEAGTKSRARLRDIGTNYRSDLKRLTSGYKPFPYDAADDVQTVVQALKFTMDVLPLNPSNVFIGIAVKGYADIMGIPGVQNMINDWRMRNGASATAELGDAFGPVFDSTVSRVVDLANADASGELLRALRDLHPEVFTDPAQTQITAGGVVNEHTEIFSYYNNITVRADNSVVLTAIDATHNDILNQVTLLGGGLQVALASTITHLSAIESQNKVIAAGYAGIAVFLKDQAATSAQKEKAERDRADAQYLLASVWGAAEGTLAGMSGMASLLGDKKLAKDITRFGTAVITVAKSVVAIVDAAAALAKGITVVTQLGAAAATGNIIAAVAGLVSLFAPEEPSPDETILAEIGKIQESLSKMSQQMADGFNRVDERLTTIYTSLISVLHQISVTVNLTYQETLEINARLVAQSRALGQFSLSVGAWFQAAERQGLKEDVHTALDWRSNNKEPMSAANLGLFLGHFHSWAVDSAYDEVNQPLTGRGLNLPALGTELGRELFDDLSYLNRWLVTSKRPYLAEPTAPGTQVAELPNPQMWALAAGAFAQLRAEWPDLVNPTDPRTAQIVTEGTRVRDAIRRLALDSALFPALHDDYRKAVLDLAQAIDDYRVHFQKDELPGLLGHSLAEPLPDPIDLTREHDQPFQVERVFSATCAGQANVSAPPSLRLRLPSQVTLSTWIDPATTPFACQWSASYKSWTVHIYDKNTGDMVDRVVGQVTVDLESLWDGVRIHQVTSKVSAVVPDDQDLYQYVIERWEKENGYRAQLEKSLAYKPQAVLLADLPEATRNSIIEVATQRLTHCRDLFGHQLAAEMHDGRLAPAARTVDGARLVVENMIRLLLPIPRANDDLLRAILDGDVAERGGVRLLESEPITTAIRHTWLKGDIATLIKDYVADVPEVLGARVKAWQDRINDGAFTNWIPPIDDVLDRIALSDYVVQWYTALHDEAERLVDGLRVAVHLSPPGGWTEELATRLQLVRSAAMRGERPDVKALQAAIGAVADGVWGTQSQKALVTTVRQIQAALNVESDGVWGPLTDKALTAARP